MWDLPRPRIEPVSPALAVRFFTAEPPGEPSTPVFLSGKSCGQWSQRATVHGVVKQSDATKFKKKKMQDTHTLRTRSWNWISSCQKKLLWQISCFFLCSMNTQLCPILCDPMDCSPPASFVHVILQVGILEWIAMSFSRGFSQTRDWTRVSTIAGSFFTIWASKEAYIRS